MQNQGWSVATAPLTPLVGREVGPPFRSLATLGGVGDGPDCRRGFADAEDAEDAADAADAADAEDAEDAEDAVAAAAVAPAAGLAAVPGATAGVWARTHWGVPSSQPAAGGAEPGRQGKGGWGASRGRRRCSERTTPGDIQAPGEEKASTNSNPGT